MPFDVSKMISGKSLVVENHKHDVPVAPKPLAAKVETKSVVAQSAEPISHYAENITPIGNIVWRKRAHIQGRVTSIRTAPSGAAPVINVEIWDETGGVTLQFLGRREIRGLDIGTELRAEGMVADNDGKMNILNPSYELLK
jgi:RecG-like helicase